MSFKPYYKWITFNTILKEVYGEEEFIRVLNLIINGLPSIQDKKPGLIRKEFVKVLNLIINGLPSILI